MTAKARKSSSDPGSDPVLALKGELTIYTAAAEHGRLREHLAAGGGCQLDLSGVTEIDSAGLQLLLLARKEAEDRGSAFSIVDRSPAVEEVLSMLQLARTFGLTPASAGGSQ